MILIDSKATAFFCKYAGYSTPPGKTACARALAEAEKKGQDKGWTIEFEPDDQPAQYQDEAGNWLEDDKAVAATLYDEEGAVIGSLGGIMEDHKSNKNRMAYRRVIYAELCQEATSE